MARRRSLKKLPAVDQEWEVGLLALREGGPGLAGFLVVAEQRSGAIRLADGVELGRSPAALFRRAFLAPEPPSRPARPTSLVFDSEELADQLAEVAVEAGVASLAIGPTPAVDEGLATLLQAAGAPVAPGIDRDLGAWRAAIRDLIRLAPWTTLDDRVDFTFSGGGLDDAVATVTGRGGRIPGVVLSPTRADLEALRAASAERRMRSSGSATHLMLDEPSGLTAAEVERCLRAGLQFPPGLYPRVYRATPDGFARPSAAEQDLLLTAVRAIVALCERDLAPLGSGITRTMTVGDVGVTGTPPPR